MFLWPSSFNLAAIFKIMATFRLVLMSAKFWAKFRISYWKTFLVRPEITGIKISS